MIQGLSRADWTLLLGAPAAILAAGAVAAALLRWYATSMVFWVLQQNPARWASLARDVKEFEPLFRAGEMANRFEQENKVLHTLVTEKLAPIAAIAAEMGDLKMAVTLLKDQVSRFANAVEDMPERMAVIEERQRNEQQQRTGPRDRRRDA